MSRYNQLDLDFLDVDIEELDTDVLKHPEEYIKDLKFWFSEAVDSYNQASPWWLPFELDIDELVQTMSLEAKVAQLFIFGLSGTVLTEDEQEFLETVSPGGVILMWKNVLDDPEQMLAFTQDLQSTQEELPLFVSIDQEWGQVKRIVEDLPGQPYLSVQAICDVYRTRAKALADLGINFNFGIVADTTDNVASFIYPRVFQWEVNQKVQEAVRCTHKTLSTLKHFPWHGGTTNDTHQGVARITTTKSVREEADLQAFLSGSWADSIMMGHLIADFLDPELPATLSLASHDYLRQVWYEGLIVTDDMWMIDQAGNELEQLEAALVAGNDMLLYVDHEITQKIMDHANDFVSQGWITSQDLDARVRRILAAKQKIISRDDFVPLDLIR